MFLACSPQSSSLMPPPTKSIAPPHPPVRSERAYSFTFKAVGGTAPHTFTRRLGRRSRRVSPSPAKVSSPGTPTAGRNVQLLHQGHGLDSVCRARSSSRSSIDSKLTITTNSLPAATRGVPYSYNIGLSGGTATSWTVSAGTLPPGLHAEQLRRPRRNRRRARARPPSRSRRRTARSRTRSSSRSPSSRRSGSRSARSRPRSSGSRSRRSSQRPVASAPTPSRSPVAPLPSGLTFDTASGVIAGTPRSAGNYPLQISVTASGGGAAVQTLGLVVRSKLGFATKTLPVARVGRNYVTQIVVKGGVLPFTLTSSSIFPRGLSLNGETGLAHGQARVAPAATRSPWSSTTRTAARRCAASRSASPAELRLSSELRRRAPAGARRLVQTL